MGIRWPNNASSARFVLGSKAVPVKNLDLRLIGMVFEKNGKVMGTGAGAAVGGHPALSCGDGLRISSLSDDLASEAGEVILSGALTAALEANKGDVFTASCYRV